MTSRRAIAHAILTIVAALAAGSATRAQSLCEPCDCDCDGLITGADWPAFMDTIQSGIQCSPCAGDANGDGVTDITDIDEMIRRCPIDCNANNANDGGEILDDPSLDLNHNGIIDSCEPICVGPGCGACCVGPNACRITNQSDCEQVYAGVFLGAGVPCPIQFTVIPIHDAEQWTHVIEVESGCPNRGTAPCADGPYHIDPWVTVAGGTSCENFGHPSACPIPAGFFDPGSDPFTGTICFSGAPIGTVTPTGFPGPIDFGSADTIVRRDDDPFPPEALPSPAQSTVAIRIERLNLVSTAPITVTYGGGSPEQWDVRVEISSSVSQPAGSLTAEMTHCNGGTFDSTLPACPVLRFTKVGAPGVERLLDVCGSGCGPIVMLASGVDWIARPDPGVQLISPVCSGFHPGVRQNWAERLACDCNGNNLHDSYEIEAGLQPDCNGNGVPDPCDVASGASRDENGDGVPDECPQTGLPALSGAGALLLAAALALVATIVVRRRRTALR